MASEPGTIQAFTQLHPTVREALYRMAWTQLRPIQVDAIHHVFNSEGDFVIAARTAAGKTEAAFLPILSQIVNDPTGSVRAIYVGPLKALINDQFLRLERLCEIAEIPVHKWHGDVGQAAKKKLLDAPSGVLLITPESIESLFVNHPNRLARVFSRLGFVVIDEMHSFLGTERGAHLKSLISRLSTKSREPVRRIGLSATLGDTDAARRWLRPLDPKNVRLISDESDEKVIRLRIYGYLFSRPRVGGPASRNELDESQIDRKMPVDIFDAFQGRTALIFACSKSILETCADFARRESSRRGLSDLFRVHHGSLSKGEREDTEDALRSKAPTATFCSSTLEMGIDIGSVQAIGQIGPAWTVASMTQRLGRSGRKDGEAQEMRIYVEEEKSDANVGLVKLLFPKLLQSIAMTELLVREKWCEPPEVDRLHLSTLIQQVMSVISETGGARAEQLFDTLARRGAFMNVDLSIFLQTLRDMGAADLIEQTPEGLLILGLKGEEIVHHHDFYMAFKVEEEYRVTCQGRHIGSALPPAPTEDPFIILAGRRWRVLDIDHDRRSILVEHSAGGRAPEFVTKHGGEIHPRVRILMRELLFRELIPSYLDPGATELLRQARATALQANLHRQQFIQDGSELIWFTWTGSRIQHTLFKVGTVLGEFKVEDLGIALLFKNVALDQMLGRYQGALNPKLVAEDLVDQPRYYAIEKYEPYLSEPLLSFMVGRERLDLEGARRIIAELTSPGLLGLTTTGRLLEDSDSPVERLE